MTPDPGQLKVSRAPAGLPRARPERIGTWLIWTFGPCIAVFGAALLAMGDDQSKVVGACVILPSGLFGQFLVVASSLRMSHKNWDQSVGI